MNRPTLYMLVGIPCSGKTTWIQKNGFDNQQTHIASTDSYIESVAAVLNTTYNFAFHANIVAAQKAMEKALVEAISLDKDIVWDQTNVSFLTRKRKLQTVPNRYRKVAVFFPTPNEEILNARLNSRPGKEIPKLVLANMINSLDPPEKNEGFDEVIVVQ